MPGIVGLISQRPHHECEHLVRSMLETIKHEQTHITGTCVVPELGAYVGWVTIGGAFASSHPFSNKQRNVDLIFTGECFGHSPDQLLDLYHTEGAQFIKHLNGLFSGLVIDRRQEKVFLFNDRFGSERIYWHESGDGFYFASEAKALLRVLPHLREFDPVGVAQFCAFGCTFHRQTLFREVELLPGASIFRFEDGSCEKRKYFDVQDWESLPTLPHESFQLQFEDTFRLIVPRYFESNLNTGISLTGGLDTRMIVACRPGTAKTPVSYTFTGPAGTTRDDRIASQVAAACHLPHTLIRLNDDFFTGFVDHADQTVFVTDGCFGITGAHEIYFNRQARGLAPVRITGLFGSEILRGISTFKPIGLSPSLFDPEFAKKVNHAADDFTGAANPVTAAAFQNIPWNLFGSLAAARSQVIVRTPYLDNELVSLAYQAPAALRTSAGSAVRIVANNKNALTAIPTDRRIENKERGLGARLLRLPVEASFKLDYLYNEGMPHWLAPLDGLFRRINSRVKLFGHHKYLHYRSWFRSELSTYVRETLANPAIEEMPFWRRGFIRHMADAHIRGERNYTAEINAVLTLAAVERLLLRGLPNAIDSGLKGAASRSPDQEVSASL